ncbi:TPA: host nuclease inhibitor protein [Salmonella enterica]
MKSTVTAYCWASGLIEFGHTMPEGELPIITGNEKDVREHVEALARIAYNGNLLVPGIPEAPNQHEACNALIRFCRVIRERFTHPNRRRFRDE